MMTAHPFPGTDQELRRLAAATANNCTCLPSEDGIAGPECPAHAMLSDEHICQHLVFGARRAAELLKGEFTT